MLKAIETEVLGKAIPATIKAEFAQHDFERLKGFCSLIYIASIGVWLLFNLIVSFKGGQGFTYLSMIFMSIFGILTIVQYFIRKAVHFHVLNLFFVLAISIGMRLVVNGLPLDFHPAWLLIGSSTVLYSASVLPLSRWSFCGAVLIVMIVLNPFLFTGLSPLELKGDLILTYALFLGGLTLYSFIKLSQAKLHTYRLTQLLLEQAYLDPLTNIPNRRAFMAQAGERLLNESGAQDHYLAMIDIDNFKRINDVYGHDTGDEVLKRVAADIKTVVADYDYARLGGEEFAIYLSGVRRGDVAQLADTLCRVIRERQTSHPVTVSIGLAQVEPGDTLNQALIKADSALYQSKHSGKDRYTFM